MVLGDPIEKSIKNSLKNIAPKQPQSIPTSMTQLSTMMSPPSEMVPNVPLIAVALGSPHAIENGKRRTFVNDGTKLDELKMVAWGHSQLCSRENLCFGEASAMVVPSLEILDQTVNSDQFKI